MTCCNDVGCHVDGTHVHVEVLAGEFGQEEIEAYRAKALEKIASGELPEDTCRMTLEDVGDGDVRIGYYRPNDTPIERIRRITGYLVGSLSRFNDAKKAEERDRFKHLSRKTFSTVEDCSSCEKDKPAECVGCPGKA